MISIKSAITILALVAGFMFAFSKLGKQDDVRLAMIATGPCGSDNGPNFNLYKQVGDRHFFRGEEVYEKPKNLNRYAKQEVGDKREFIVMPDPDLPPLAVNHPDFTRSRETCDAWVKKTGIKVRRIGGLK